MLLTVLKYFSHPTQKEDKEAGEENATKLTNRHTASEDTPSDEEGDQAHLALPEDASDVEPSEDIDLELTEEQKGELSAQKDELAAMVCIGYLLPSD